eukprot:210646-Amphidinium_carterae.1
MGYARLAYQLEGTQTDSESCTEDMDKLQVHRLVVCMSVFVSRFVQIFVVGSVESFGVPSKTALERFGTSGFGSQSLQIAV